MHDSYSPVLDCVIARVAALLSLIMEAQVVWMVTSPLFREARSPVTGRRLYQTLPHPHSGRRSQTYLFPLKLKVKSESFLFSFPVATSFIRSDSFIGQCESPTRFGLFGFFFPTFLYLIQNCAVIPQVVLDHPLFIRCLLKDTDWPVGGDGAQHRSPSALLY